MNYMISMFIDDELDMDEKISFIKTVKENKSFTDEALDLLHQEKLVRGDVVEHIPYAEVKTPFNWKRFFRPFIQPMGLVASALTVAVIYLFIAIPPPIPGTVMKRFVIYRPIQLFVRGPSVIR